MAKQQTKNWSDELSSIADSLRNPFRLRMLIAGVFIIVIYFAIGEPIHGQLNRSRRELKQLKTKLATAEQVSLLRSRVDHITPRLITGAGTDPVINHMMSIIRTSSADLVRMDAESTMRIGPFEAIRLRIDLKGSFAALDEVLSRVNNDAHLLRIDSFALAPDQRDPGQTSMQLSVLMLKESQ